MSGKGGRSKNCGIRREIRKGGESLPVVTSGLPSPGLPEESPPEVPKEQGQKRQGKQPRAPPGSFTLSLPHIGTQGASATTSKPPGLCGLPPGSPRPRGPESGKGMNGTGDGPVSDNNTILLPQDVIRQTCAQPPLSQAWGERGGQLV